MLSLSYAGLQIAALLSPMAGAAVVSRPSVGLAFVRFMIESLGIAPDRLAANGFGEFQPVNTDDTPEARAQNRRIELKFTER